MGKTNDFLWQGSPPPLVNSNGTTTTQVPAYLQQYHEGVLSRANAIAAKPYTPYDKQRIANTDPALQQGWQMGGTAATSYQDEFGQAAGQLGKAAAGNASGAAAPWLQKAGNLSGTGAAAGALGQAMQSSAGMVNGYMSPYLTGVVDQIAKKGNEALQQNLTSMGDDFIRAGQLGSSVHMGEAGKALEKSQEAISNAQTQALNQGYTTALGAAQNDLGRYAQVGATQGNLALGEQQNLGALGQISGNLNSIDTKNALDTAQGYVGMGKADQAAGLTGAAALEAIGRGKMGIEQQNLDLAHDDWSRQQDYGRNNVDWMATLTRGQPNMGGTVYSDENKPLSNAEYGPSGLAQIAGGISLANNIGNLFGKRDGGYIDANEAAEAYGGALSMVERKPPAKRPPPVRVPRRRRAA